VVNKANRLEFESLGEDQVASRVRANLWSEDKLREAREWLSLESSKIARSAKNAAWIAAIAAIVAAISAVVTIFLSVYSKHPPS
jgi:hypothetical protein